MPLPGVDAEPAGEGVERMVRKLRREDHRQVAHVDRTWRPPWPVRELVLALQDGKVEADRVPDHDGTAHPLPEVGPDIGKPRGLRHVGVGQSVDPGRFRRDRNAGVGERAVGVVVDQPALAQPDRPDLDQAGAADGKARGLGVEGDRAQRIERRCGRDFSRVGGAHYPVSPPDPRGSPSHGAPAVAAGWKWAGTTPWAFPD